MDTEKPSVEPSPIAPLGFLLWILLTENHSRLENRLAGIKAERPVLHPSWFFRLLSRRCDQVNAFKAQLGDTQWTSSSLSAGGCYGNAHPSCQALLLAALWSDAAWRCGPAVRWCNNLPDPSGGVVIWAPAAPGRPLFNRSNSHVATQSFHLQQQTNLSSCFLFLPNLASF